MPEQQGTTPSYHDVETHGNNDSTYCNLVEVCFGCQDGLRDHQLQPTTNSTSKSNLYDVRHIVVYVQRDR